MTKALAVAVVVAVGGVVAVAAGVVSGVEPGAKGQVHAPAQSRARHFRDGPVHGLMLIPLADPDGHVPTADKH